jgi:hypothetical protein
MSANTWRIETDRKAISGASADPSPITNAVLVQARLIGNQFNGVEKWFEDDPDGFLNLDNSVAVVNLNSPSVSDPELKLCRGTVHWKSTPVR